MSKLETNTIDTVSGTSTLQVGSTNTSTITLGVSGDTINVPSGVTIANSGTATGFGGANTPAFEALLGSNQSISNNTQTKVQFGTENFDTDNCYDNSTNYRFTPTTSGKYFIYSTLSIQNGQNVGIAAHLEIRKNGSKVFLTQTNVFNNTVLNVVSVSACSILTLNGSSDYVEIFGLGENNSGTPTFLGTSANGQCIFGGYKIIE